MKKRIFLVFIWALLMVSCGNGYTEKVIESYDSGKPYLVRVYDRSGTCIKEIGYYESGALMMEGAIKDGHREGPWKSYYEDGKTQTTGFFHEGLRTGKATVYHPNGHLYMEGNYTNNHHSGVWTYYDEQGYLLRTDDYGDGE